MFCSFFSPAKYVQCEIDSIRKQFESDFAIWKREQETTNKLRQIEESNSIRQQCRAERDKQIDAIVAKIDEETLLQKQDFEAKVRYVERLSWCSKPRKTHSSNRQNHCCFKNSRLKSQHETELRDMERTERQTRDKYMETRSKLAQIEAEAKNLHATVNQLEIQLTHSQKVCFEMSLFFTSNKK